MRTFIAIELPIQLKEKLSQLQEGLKASNGDVKWVEPKNIHLTLKFLGELELEKIKKVEALLEEIAKTHTSYSTTLSEVGTFPRSGLPRVIWVGVSKGESETKKIAEDIEAKAAKIGINKEKRLFSSHITIGRVRSGKNSTKLLQELARLKSFPRDARMEFTVTKITLFKSTLTPQGPIYEIVKEAHLTSI